MPDDTLELEAADLDAYVQRLNGAANASPADRAKLKGLLAHYGKMAHPFTACVRDNTKRFGPQGAERVCATLKDIIRGTTHWRKGGRKMAAADLPQVDREFWEWVAGVDVEAATRDYELPTVDLEAVEILSVGGPIHGVGSPPEGDYWTPEQLRGMADAAAELGDEVKPAAKIGHKGGDPAVGWLENIRINDDGSRLLADIRKVPRGLSSLIDAGAYRTRSVELRQLTSQKTGKKHDWVVSGLAWLGGKMPAVRTLADVVKLYEADEDPDRRFVEITEATLDADALRDAVADLGRDLAETARERPASDSSPVPTAYTDEKRRKFAEATGLELDKVTDEMLSGAGVLAEDPAPDPDPDPKPDPDRDLAADERFRKFEEKAEAADERSRKLEEELAGERKRNFVEGLLKEGKAEPGQRGEIETMYDASPDAARKFFDTVKVNDDLGREYGSGELGDEPSEEEAEKRDLAERESIAREFNIPVEEVA